MYPVSINMASALRYAALTAFRKISSGLIAGVRRGQPQQNWLKIKTYLKLLVNKIIESILTNV